MQFSASQRGFPRPCALNAGSHFISGHGLASRTVLFIGFMKNHLTGNVSSGCLRAEFGSPGTGRVWWGKDLEVVSVLSLDLVGVRNRNGLKSSCLGNAQEKQNIRLMLVSQYPLVDVQKWLASSPGLSPQPLLQKYFRDAFVGLPVWFTRHGSVAKACFHVNCD